MPLRRNLVLFLLFCVSCPSMGHAVWIWTPETGKFINPKMAVKSTPQEQLDFARNIMAQKKFPLAIAEFKKVLRLKPDFQPAARALMKAQQTRALERNTSK